LSLWCSVAPSVSSRTDHKPEFLTSNPDDLRTTVNSDLIIVISRQHRLSAKQTFSIFFDANATVVFCRTWVFASHFPALLPVLSCFILDAIKETYNKSGSYYFFPSKKNPPYLRKLCVIL
jgi:hypothetical protein